MGHYSNECPDLTEEERAEKKRKRMADQKGPVLKKQGPGNFKKPEAKNIPNMWKQAANGYKHKANVVRHDETETETEFPDDQDDQETA
jgi:hypothetical protein